MLELVHNTSKPFLAALRAVRNMQKRDEPKDHDSWVDLIHTMVEENDRADDVSDMASRFATWTRINALREVQKMLEQNNDGRYARQKIEFLIRSEL